jgi:hypothetical protein
MSALPIVTIVVNDLGARKSIPVCSLDGRLKLEIRYIDYNLSYVISLLETIEFPNLLKSSASYYALHFTKC